MAKAVEGPIRVSAAPALIPPDRTRWREKAFALWGLATASLPLTEWYADECFAKMQPAHVLRDTVALPLAEVPCSLWFTHAQSWFRCAEAQRRPPFTSNSEEESGVCEIGPAQWRYHLSGNGYQLTGPLTCFARVPIDSHGASFSYQVSDDGRIAVYSCSCEEPNCEGSSTRQLALRALDQRRPLPPVTTPWSVVAQHLHHAGPWSEIGLLGIALVSLARRRRPDARWLQRRWRAAVTEGNGVATLHNGEAVRLPAELSSRLSRGAPLLIDASCDKAATYRDQPWIPRDAVWEGTEDSLRERVQNNTRRRWRTVALFAASALALAAAEAGSAGVALSRRAPDVIETITPPLEPRPPWVWPLSDMARLFTTPPWLPEDDEIRWAGPGAELELGWRALRMLPLRRELTPR